jgi:hypothetical protein
MLSTLNCKVAKNSYGDYQTEFVGSTQNPKKNIGTSNQPIKTKNFLYQIESKKHNETTNNYKIRKQVLLISVVLLLVLIWLRQKTVVRLNVSHRVVQCVIHLVDREHFCFGV